MNWVFDPGHISYLGAAFFGSKIGKAQENCR